jgi:hypothetical protein
MLAMDIDEGAPEFFEHTKRAQTTVDVHPVTAGTGQHAPKNQLGLVLTDDFLLPQSLKKRMGVGEVEGGFKLGLVFS